MDYGCGVGRIAKEILFQRSDVKLIAVDNSQEMRDLALEYIGPEDGERFQVMHPDKLPSSGIATCDVIYSIYCFQHIPAVHLTEALRKVNWFLRETGYFVYCSSECRMAVRSDVDAFYDDRHLGVNVLAEVNKFFDTPEQLFTQEVFDANPVVNSLVNGKIKHPALKYQRRK